MARVYLSVGSNIEPGRNIKAALKSLRRCFGRISVSTVYRCPAEGFEGDDFYNLAVGFDTDRGVAGVNDCLHAIEASMGRTRSERKFSDRKVDLDLLLYDELIVDQPGLRIPRPDILRYAFVLGPLAEIAPQAVHPELNCSIAELWQRFEGPRSLTPVEI